jgi:N-acetylated-alpha-linked acidic dipeptidase
MANAELLPFDFRNLHATIDRFTTELTDLTKNMRESTAIDNALIKANDYTLAADPTKQFHSPAVKDTVPTLNFTALKTALDSLKKNAGKLAENWQKQSQTDANHDKLNQALYHAEQELLSADGLPRRPWYKHTLYAPGFYTGYGVKTLPGIREAIEQRNWPEAQQQISVVAAAVMRLAGYLKTAGE